MRTYLLSEAMGDRLDPPLALLAPLDPLALCGQRTLALPYYVPPHPPRFGRVFREFARVVRRMLQVWRIAHQRAGIRDSLHLPPHLSSCWPPHGHLHLNDLCVWLHERGVLFNEEHCALCKAYMAKVALSKI